MYVVAGARPEPRLGDHDTKDLGNVSFNPDRRSLQGNGGDESHENVRNISTSATLRNAGKEVVTERPPLHRAKTKGKEGANQNGNGYKGLVVTDSVGRRKIEEERLATHLKKLKAEDAIERGPRRSHPTAPSTSPS